ncbi:hypothetical protein [Enterovibrio calviensis]|uniref:hypothetical protein n=1 Tax=Enterovibrio calviensis TaxID=91359 RepID=UPI0004859BF5|nr:hypothetical protein [Enterovibrio calviensis]
MLGSLTSLTGGGGLTGGEAGPATSGNTSYTTNSSGFHGGSISLGSSTGLPWWGIVAMVLAALYVFSKK